MKGILLAASALLVAFASAAVGHEPIGTPKPYCEPASEWSVHDYGPPAAGFLLLGATDGNLADCDGDGDRVDFDGHAEHALGGAFLLACEASCGPGGQGAGSWACFGEPAHHDVIYWPPFMYGPFAVFDAMAEGPAGFFIAVDEQGTEASLGDEACGDLEFDRTAWCSGFEACFVTFAPGRDGSYVVFVGEPGPMSWGHVSTPGYSS